MLLFTLISPMMHNRLIATGSCDLFIFYKLHGYLWHLVIRNERLHPRYRRHRRGGPTGESWSGWVPAIFVSIPIDSSNHHHHYRYNTTHQHHNIHCWINYYIVPLLRYSYFSTWCYALSIGIAKYLPMPWLSTIMPWCINMNGGDVGLVPWHILTYGMLVLI